MSSPGHGFLEPPEHLTVRIARGAGCIGTFEMVGGKAAELGVEEDFPFRDGGQRGDPGDETGLSGEVRGHATEAIEVPAREVHQNRLGDIVQVEA